MGMDEDIKEFGVYGLTHTGELVPVPVYSTINYKHLTHQLHHYIKQQDYKRNKSWYDERGIKQKLILLPIHVHEQVHNKAIKNLTDKDFLEKFKISRWDLVFNRKFSKY